VRRAIFLAGVFIWLSASTAFAADRLRIAYSSISGAYAGIWVARDAGFFAKENLDDQIIFIPSATQLAQSLGRGRCRHRLGSKGSPVMAASLSGADLKVIGNNVNKLIFLVPRKPEVKNLERTAR
jgi:ABC-type nitrate/sulfonate/bicarbonate transport system substrate-binding protein